MDHRVFLTVGIAWILVFALMSGAGGTGGVAAVAIQEPKRRFVSFEIEERRVHEGSIINVPTRCPKNTLKIGNRCRTVF